VCTRTLYSRARLSSPVPASRSTIRRFARLYSQKEIHARSAAVQRRGDTYVPPFRRDGYRFAMVDAIGPRERSDDRLRSVTRVGKVVPSCPSIFQPLRWPKNLRSADPRAPIVIGPRSVKRSLMRTGEREREREGGGEARVKRDALAPSASLRFSLGGLP